MLGWSIVVTALPPEQHDPASRDASARLAIWEAGPGGIDWLTDLVKQGKADQLVHCGYPSRFVAKARDVLPLLLDGPPRPRGPEIIGDDYVLPANWLGKTEMHEDRIAACSPDQALTIDAWDLS